MNAGHWVPEMVERAGGVSVKTNVGYKSYSINLEWIVKTDTRIIIFASCGFDFEGRLREKYLMAPSAGQFSQISESLTYSFERAII
jgi:ABC-type Fe3+-hydroxamate transport system substrate-binding protein